MHHNPMKTLQGSFYHLQIYEKKKKKRNFPKVLQPLSGKARIWAQVCLLPNLYALLYAPLTVTWRWKLREIGF